MKATEAAEFCAEFHAQRNQLTHATRQLLAQVDHPADRVAIEEAHAAAHRAMMTLARVAAHTPDRPHLQVVR